VKCSNCQITMRIGVTSLTPEGKPRSHLYWCPRCGATKEAPAHG
jgi:hypothetical protein